MSVCPNCGGDHDWEPRPGMNIDRDITAIVALLLGEECTVEAFAEIVNSSDRAPTMLMRACQAVAQFAEALFELQGSEDPRADARDAMRLTLLEYATEEEEILEPEDEEYLSRLTKVAERINKHVGNIIQSEVTPVNLPGHAIVTLEMLEALCDVIDARGSR